MAKVKKIKTLEGFSNATDVDVIDRAAAVHTGMTGNPHFPNPPVDLDSLKKAIDSFSALRIEALDGSKKIIAQKNKQREAVVESRVDHRLYQAFFSEKQALQLPKPHPSASVCERGRANTRRGRLHFGSPAAFSAAAFMCWISFSFSRHINSSNSVSGTRTWFTLTVHGLV